MDILRDDTVLALVGVDWAGGEVAAEARREAKRRGLVGGVYDEEA